MPSDTNDAIDDMVEKEKEFVKDKTYIECLEGIARAILHAEVKAIEINEYEHFKKEIPGLLRKIAKITEKKFRFERVRK